MMMMMMMTMTTTAMMMMVRMTPQQLTYQPSQGQCESSQFEKTTAAGMRESATD